MERVPIEELVDLDQLAARVRERTGRDPTRRDVRAALPRGWVLEEDGRTARRDVRLFFREGWILLVGLALFGAAGAALFWHSFPSGWAGVLRFAVMLLVLLLAGGVVAPVITRALSRKR